MMPLFINMAGADPFRENMLDKSITLRNGIDITALGGDTDLDLSASSGDIKAPSGGITGDIIGDVTGDLTGNVTGDLTGDATGDLTGNVTGDLTGDVTGDVTGDLIGNVTGDLTGDVTGDVTGDLTGNVTGDLTGDVTGDLTGNVTGDLAGDVTGDLTGNLTSGTGAQTINGVATVKNDTKVAFGTTTSAAVNYLQYVSAGNYFDMGGNPLFSDGARWTGNLVPTAGSDLVATSGESDLNFAASTGFTNTTTDTNYINGNVEFAKNIAYPVNATLTINTTLTSANTKVIYPIDASAGNKTLILPDAATVTGRMYMISTTADPGTYNIAISATGGDTIGTAASLATTTPAGLTLISDGTRYGVVGSYGTWT